MALGKESDEPEIDPYEPPNQGPALSPTFDSDDNALYYRAYEPKAGEGGWLTRYLHFPNESKDTAFPKETGCFAKNIRTSVQNLS